MQYLLTLLVLYWISYYASATVLPDTVNTAKEHLTLAQQYEAQSDLAQAIEHYELAKSDFAQEQDHLNLVYVLTQLASLYTPDTATQTQAEVYLDSAQLILEEKQIENDTLYVFIWSTRAKLVWTQRKFYKAIEHYQKSLERKRAFYGEDHLEVASDLGEIGGIYLYDLQNPHQSAQYHENELKIREYLGDESRQYFNCFYNLTFAYRLLRDSEKALPYGIKALRGYEGLAEPSYRNIVYANDLISAVYLNMDSLHKTLNYNRKAIDLANKEGLTLSVDMALLYNNQAFYHSELEAYDSTIHYARLALTHQTSSVNLANSYQFLGHAYRGKKMLERAFRNYRKSQVLKESIFNHHHTQLAVLYFSIGKTFEAAQQVDSAIHYYQRALTNARIGQDESLTDFTIQVGDDLNTMQDAVAGLIDLLIEQYDQTKDFQYLDRSLSYFILFDQIMDLTRTNFSTEGSKLMLSSNHKVTYERAIASSHELYQVHPSDSLLQWIFHFMEKSKAMVLLESIRQAERSQRILPDSLVKQYQSLQAQLAYYQSRLIDAEQDSSESSTITELQRKSDVLRELEVLNQYIQAHYPNYYNITYQDMTVRLDSLREYVPPRQPVVSYFWGDSAVYALLTTSDKVKIYRVENMNALNKAIAQYQDALVNDVVGDPSYAKFLQFQENAHTLYQLLLEPILPDDTIEHLTIVPDGDLTTIPFESLITSIVKTDQNDIRYERLPYLIKQYNISYEFSLSIAFGKRDAEAETDDGELTVTAFGIKNFNNLPGNQRYPRLGGAEREVRYVQEKFPQARIFLNAEATEAQFKQQAPEADILHIATHGMADTENPFASRFIFYPGEQEDGILHLYELYDMPLKAQLLLLSACESGVGKHYIGEGNFSLARSFVYAGCNSVLMSLWQVDDIVTEQMIRSVYDRIADESTVSGALRNSKLAFIEGKTYAHPQCWAGVVPLGNSTLEFSESRYATILTVLLALFGSSVIGVALYAILRKARTRSILKYLHIAKANVL